MSLLQHFRKPTEPPKHRLQKVLHAMEMLLVEKQDSDLERDRDLDWEYEHMNEAVRYAKMIAIRRKIDPDLAACAVAAQNIGRITTGRTDGHAESGYKHSKHLFLSLGCFTSSEIEQLAVAVRNHSRKDRIDSPLDELCKDVDIYVRYVQGEEFSTPYELHRLSAVRLEFQTKMKT